MKIKRNAGFDRNGKLIPLGRRNRVSEPEKKPKRLSFREWLNRGCLRIRFDHASKRFVVERPDDSLFGGPDFLSGRTPREILLGSGNPREELLGKGPRMFPPFFEGFKRR